MRRLSLIITVIMILGLLCGCGKSKSQQNQSAEAIGIHHAVITVKNYGEIKLELDGDTAPNTVQNFMDLANGGYYNGTSFHRIIDGFMIQGGAGDGSAESIVGEFTSNGYQNDIKHEYGTVSMARTSDPNSASSQFFIVQGNASHLDGQYAAFGHVTDGMDIVDKIAKDAVNTDGNGSVAQEKQPIIESIKITD